MDLPKLTDEDKKIILACELIKEGVGSVGLMDFYKKSEKSGYVVREDDIRKMKRDLRRLSVGILGFWEERYPKGLLQLSDRPVIIFYKGDKDLLSESMVTVVGTRRSSVYGNKVVQMIVTVLANRGVVVVSGLAYGVDRKVHQTAMRTGSTIAVVAGGIDQGFPDTNRYLYDQISKDHLVLAEFPPGRGVVKGMFPMRNRIMAALSSHTIVVEAPVQSGALITSSIAVDLGREVYSVPGHIISDTSKGTNLLIEQGALMVNSSKDIEEICLKSDEFFNRLKMS